MYVCMYVLVCTSIYVCMYVCMHACMYTSLSLYISIHIYIYIYIYLHTHTHTHPYLRDLREVVHYVTYAHITIIGHRLSYDTATSHSPYITPLHHFSSRAGADCRDPSFVHCDARLCLRSKGSFIHIYIYIYIPWVGIKARLAEADQTSLPLRIRISPFLRRSQLTI